MNLLNRHILIAMAAGCCLSVIGQAGCRAHPVSLAISLVGDVVDDRDIERRKPALLGKDASAADAMFGRRHDTLIDVSSDYRWLIYPEPGERMAESFYVVETRADIIEGLFKCKRNIDGLEDVRHARDLEKKLLGKSAADVAGLPRFASPVQVMRSQVGGVIAKIYDAHNWTHTRGARYCVLTFDRNDVCREVSMLGVTATTTAASQ